MSDKELEVLITLDDPEYGPDEDRFHHEDTFHQLQQEATWPEQGQEE